MSLRHRAHRVALLPLDDRPVNTKLIRMLGQMIDYEVLIPPVEMIGHFDEPGNPEALMQWLLNTTNEVDSILVAIDMLAYGGHVASRQPNVRTDTAVRHSDKALNDYFMKLANPPKPVEPAKPAAK